MEDTLNIIGLPSYGLADTYRRQVRQVYSRRCIRYLSFMSIRTSLKFSWVQHIEDAYYYSSRATASHSRCLCVISGYLGRTHTAQDEGRGKLPARKVVDRHEEQEAPPALASWPRSCIKQIVAGILGMLHPDRSRSELEDSRPRQTANINTMQYLAADAFQLYHLVSRHGHASLPAPRHQFAGHQQCIRAVTLCSEYSSAV